MDSSKMQKEPQLNENSTALLPFNNQGDDQKLSYHQQSIDHKLLLNTESLLKVGSKNVGEEVSPQYTTHKTSMQGSFLA